jgi:hypothetical protein
MHVLQGSVLLNGADIVLCVTNGVHVGAMLLGETDKHIRLAHDKTQAFLLTCCSSVCRAAMRSCDSSCSFRCSSLRASLG